MKMTITEVEIHAATNLVHPIVHAVAIPLLPVAVHTAHMQRILRNLGVQEPGSITMLLA